MVGIRKKKKYTLRKKPSRKRTLKRKHKRAIRGGNAREKVLFILTSRSCHDEYLHILRRFADYVKRLSATYDIDVAFISGEDDFSTYESILPFKYKRVNPEKQLDKLCTFLSECPERYDWYVKTRPDLDLLQDIPFSSLPKDSINARARVYTGPAKLEDAASIGGEGFWKHITGEIHYSPELTVQVLDDIVYIFHKDVLDQGAFSPLTEEERAYRFPLSVAPPAQGVQDEWFHTNLWNHRKIKMNVIGLKCRFMKKGDYAHSGHINTSV